MTSAYALLWMAGFVPLGVAWRANSGTSLLHATGWGIAAWLMWGWPLLLADATFQGLEPGRFVALCFTGAAGITVLGARRPQVFAWNFVVAGLLSVVLLPLAESLSIGTDPVDPLRITFVSATLAAGVLNYLPTRAAPAILLLSVALGGELVSLFAPGVLPEHGLELFHVLVLLSPWVGWACFWRPQSSLSEFDRLWLDFRDRLGFFWAQRVREQFNRAASNAGWPVHLRWRGLHRTVRGKMIAPSEQQAMIDTLRAALQRFTEK
jgi:hypothetical protein